MSQTTLDPAKSPEGTHRPQTAAEVWQRYDDDEQRLSAHVSERMLDLAALRPGQRVLDIASGRGEPAIRAARRVSPEGFVVGTDTSAEMLSMARARATREAVTDLSFVVTSGETLAGIPDGVFDAGLCRWGFMFFAHPRDAMVAVRRRLKVGAALVSAVWTSPEQVSWWSMPRDLLARQLPTRPVDQPDPPDPHRQRLFRYAVASTFRDDLEASGFQVEFEEERYTSVMESPAAEGLVEWCLAFGMARALNDQAPSVRAAWTRDAAVEAERYREADGWYRLGGTTRIVLARAV